VAEGKLRPNPSNSQGIGSLSASRGRIFLGLAFLNLDLCALKKSCIHFALPDGKTIPLEPYNLFYSGHHAERTAKIQAHISAMVIHES